MTEHTAGPWEWHRNGAGTVEVWESKFTNYILRDGEFLSDEDARLIAAAPTMYTLFELIFRYWMTSDQPTDKEIYAAIAEVDEHFRAIAKAEEA